MTDVVDQLRVGEKVSAGHFRIDQKRALTKLRESRLADPSHWVLDVLRAAHLCGANKVTIRTDADDVEVKFDGRPFSATVMKDLLSHALGTDDDSEPRNRLFALSVAGALGVGLKYLRVQSGKVSLDLTPSGEVTVDAGDTDGTALQARKTKSLKLVSAFVRGSPEARAIKAACLSYPAQLKLDGKALAQRDPLTKRHSANGLTLYAEPDESSPESHLDLDVMGVKVCTRQWWLPGLQLKGWIEDDSMRRNASGTDVVDDDPALKAALATLHRVSLELLEERAKEPSPQLRERFAWRLMHEKEMHDGARKVLENAPLFEGPSGERISLATLKAHVKSGAPLRIALIPYPAGAYPEPCVLMSGETRRWEPLLPGSKRDDVAQVVLRNLRSKQNKAAWAAQEPEAVALPERSWLATAEIKTPRLVGVVGIQERGAGAFVRLLGDGRFLQEGEVPLLAPLRLRAVVDFTGVINDKLWGELPNPKLWSLIVDGVQEAAERAIATALAAPELSDGAQAHARDALLRYSREKKAKLPPALAQAKLFDALGGERCSLEELTAGGRWRFVPGYRSDREPPLDGSRVLALTEADKQLLAPFADGKLYDVSEQLDKEREIRKRLAAPKREPKVPEPWVSAQVNRADMHGEVAIPRRVSDELQLVLYREGFELDSTTITSRYGPIAAAIDCPALKNTSDWSKAVRDDTFKTVLEVVKEHERLLMHEVLRKYPRHREMPLAVRRFLAAFVEKDVQGKTDLDDLARAVLDAKFLDGVAGPVSLAELKGHERIWLVPPSQSAEMLAGQAAVIGEGDVHTLVEHATSVAPSDARHELLRLAELERYQKRPAYEPKMMAGLTLRTTIELADISCDAAIDPKISPAAFVEVLAENRLWEQDTLPCALPMRVVARPTDVDPTIAMTSRIREKVSAAVAAAQKKLIELALEQPEPDPVTLFHALGARLDDSLPGPLQRRLRDAPIFPCTDAVFRAAGAFDARKQVSFVTEPLTGTPRSGDPVVVATTPAVRVALQRWPRQDLTDALKTELGTRAAYFAREPVAEISFQGQALLKKRVFGRTAGEVVVSSTSEGRLELYFEQRLLCTLPGVLPSPLAAAVNCDSVTPTPAHDGVMRDARFKEMVLGLAGEAGALSVELAQRWDELKSHPTALEDALKLCTLVEPSKKKKRKQSPLFEVPLLVTTDGKPLSVGDLLVEDRQHNAVQYSPRAGSLLDSKRVVWRPDFMTRTWLEPLKLNLKDVTPELELADRVRNRPKVDALTAAVKSDWREPLEEGAIEGEVALPKLPDGKLLVDLHQGRSVLEHYSSDHAMGGIAAVNFDELVPNPSWTKAARNTQFRAALEAVERAIERLVARRVLDTSAPQWREWALAAAKWCEGKGGPVTDALQPATLFEQLDGRPVSFGTVLEEFSKTRRVAVASGELKAEGRLVLADSAETRALLDAWGITVKDVSDELQREGELLAERAARRLEQLSWPGDALVRLTITARGMSGELALPAGDPNVEVTLAKQGVRVAALPKGVAPCVAGVVDIEAMLVDEAWTEARLSPPEREAIEQHVEQLLEQLGHVVPSLSRERKADARRYVLSWLQRSGVNAAVHLDRLTGSSAALAKACVFETVEGEWVSLAVLADEVRRRGRVAVFARSLFRPDTAGALGLWAGALDDDWLSELAGLLGVKSLERVKDAAAWREQLSEEDPPKGSAELWALSRLRRDVRLLRAGALGELSPEDIDDVRWRPLGGAHPVRYDVKRKVVLLDADHVLVKQALAEAKLRRERLYVLLAAMYGAINRALERVTDAHEGNLAAALAGHLAANPQLLDPGESE